MVLVALRTDIVVGVVGAKHHRHDLAGDQRVEVADDLVPVSRGRPSNRNVGCVAGGLCAVRIDAEIGLGQRVADAENRQGRDDPDRPAIRAASRGASPHPPPHAHIRESSILTTVGHLDRMRAGTRLLRLQGSTFLWLREASRWRFIGL